MTDPSSAADLARVVVRGLAEGKVVEIEGLGIFSPDARCGFRFEVRTAPKVFIAYVKEDRAKAEALYDALEAAGFLPWMDVRKLMPAQNWPRAIESAIETSDFFLPCFSSNSVRKWGGFQSEIRYALDCARRVPLDEIFVIPVRLDRCRVPRVIQREVQYVDLFPAWESGMRLLLETLGGEVSRRRIGIET